MASDDDLLALLRARGPLGSPALQHALRRSQPSMSRQLAALGPQVLVLGAGRATRYALPQDFVGLPAQQPLHWVDEAGRVESWGRLSLLAGGRLHVQAERVDLLSAGGLHWFLAPLRLQGFLGRLQARRLAAWGLDGNPERWPVEHQLFAAFHAGDPPGALVLGEVVQAGAPPAVDDADYERLSADVAATLPAGSSAAGEQAKFVAWRHDGRHVIVKFAPPRGTPFGERWHDLLHAEALALQLLGEHGVPVAGARIVEGARRTFLESTRFDRVGLRGRRHVVALDAIHAAFVPGARRHWAATCEALERQRRLPPGSAAQVLALQQFGRLIGNTDMHFGNLSLYVAREDLARGRFGVAPLYDMLPMRWRPDPNSGGLDLLPFEPEPADLDSAARPLAQLFWRRVEAHTALSRPFRKLAAAMARGLRPR